MTLLILGGLINGIVSIIWLRGEIFREVREFLDRLFARLDNGTGVRELLANKLTYLHKCLLCAGTWIGFAEGVFFSPFHGWWSFIAAGLAYKALGHLYVQTHDLMERKVG